MQICPVKNFRNNNSFGYKLTEEFKNRLIKDEGEKTAKEKIKKYSASGNDNFVLDCNQAGFYSYSIPKYRGNNSGFFAPKVIDNPSKIELSLLADIVIDLFRRNDKAGMLNLYKDFPHVANSLELFWNFCDNVFGIIEENIK